MTTAPTGTSPWSSAAAASSRASPIASSSRTHRQYGQGSGPSVSNHLSSAALCRPDGAGAVRAEGGVRSPCPAGVLVAPAVEPSGEGSTAAVRAYGRSCAAVRRWSQQHEEDL
jgi:hypothetical protein